MAIEGPGILHAVGFDLGETLVHSPGVPLDWSPLYRDALQVTASACGLVATDAQLASGEGVLRGYNTRLNPRTDESPSARILGAILGMWGLPADRLTDATDAFFGHFRRDVQPYEDAVPTLTSLSEAGLAVGVLTDVPYGMPRRYVEGMLVATGIAPLVNALLTSVNVGRRKPDPTGLLRLAQYLGSAPGAMAYVGNERKDVEAANAAGMASVLFAPDGDASDWGQAYTACSLAQIPALLGIG